MRMPLTDQALLALRAERLAQLGAGQEYFLESRFRRSFLHLLPDGGYLALDGATLTEAWLPTADADAFRALRAELGIERALCQSFDPALLTLCLSQQPRIETCAWLFRARLPLPVAWPEPAPTARLAEPADLPKILAMHDDFFDDAAEIEALIAAQGLWLYFQAEPSAPAQLMACGLIQPIVAGQEVRDIGMVVAAPWRGRGYGSAVVRHLATLCEQQGLTPVCGCDIGNPASARSLEKAGFSTRHSLLLLTF